MLRRGVRNLEFPLRHHSLHISIQLPRAQPLRPPLLFTKLHESCCDARTAEDVLRMPGVSHAVLQITEAHGKHGGSGAYYVYLKKRR